MRRSRAPSRRRGRPCTASSRGSSGRTARRTPTGRGPAPCAARRPRSGGSASMSDRSWPTSSRIALRELADVVAAIAVLRKRARARPGSPCARARTDTARFSICWPGVVVVELARDRVALRRRAGCAIASPSAACRPWPTCSGPVGLADTNSTITRSPACARDVPNASPSASTRATIACRAAASA